MSVGYWMDIGYLKCKDPALIESIPTIIPNEQQYSLLKWRNLQQNQAEEGFGNEGLEKRKWKSTERRCQHTNYDML